jgi:hypothetical protein
MPANISSEPTLNVDSIVPIPEVHMTAMYDIGLTSLQGSSYVDNMELESTTLSSNGIPFSVLSLMILSSCRGV